MQTFKNWCKIATLIFSILKRQAQPFRAKKNSCKIAVLQGQAQPFHAKWLSNVKNCDSPKPDATLSQDMMAERQKLT